MTEGCPAQLSGLSVTGHGADFYPVDELCGDHFLSKQNVLNATSLGRYNARIATCLLLGALLQPSLQGNYLFKHPQCTRTIYVHCETCLFRLVAFATR